MTVQFVMLGWPNRAAVGTSFQNTTTGTSVSLVGDTAVFAMGTRGGQNGVTAYGNVNGVFGQAPGTGTGVEGRGGRVGVHGRIANIGVLGEGPNGVRGITQTIDGGRGVLGISEVVGGVGVYGDNTGGGTGVYGRGKPAVYGEGIGATGVGVHGSGLNGVEGYTEAPGGAGVVATNARGETALRVNGKARFTTSGTTVISPPASSAVVGSDVLGLAFSSETLVLATMQNDVPGVHVRAAVPDTSSHSFTIFLNQAVPAGRTVKVAWFIVN
jgi:hypothetical protein